MGLMGSALMQRIHAERGWDIDASRCVNASTAAQVFDSCDFVFLCLPHSDVSHKVLSAAELRNGLTVIDMTTGMPDDMAALGMALSQRGVHYLDATVSGSSVQLTQGEVTVMAGGTAQVFEQCKTLLARFAKEVIHVGPVGSGAQMKLVTNLVLGLNRAALAEGLVLAQQLKLDPELTLDVLKCSMAYSRIMDTKGEKMIRRDYTPQAKLSQHLKDVRLMLESSDVTLPLTEAHRAMLEKAVDLGFGEADNSALIEALLK